MSDIMTESNKSKKSDKAADKAQPKKKSTIKKYIISTLLKIIFTGFE